MANLIDTANAATAQPEKIVPGDRLIFKRIDLHNEGLMDLHGMELGTSDDFGPLFCTRLSGLVVIWGIWLLFKNKIDEKFDLSLHIY